MPNNVPQEVIDRYDDIIGRMGYEVLEQSDPGTSLSHLRWMLTQLNEHEDAMKAHRWLGFIQGVLIGRYQLLSVTSERNFTRGKFRHMSLPDEN